jgi:hypothetical protein
MYHHFKILSKRVKEYRSFNAVGYQIRVSIKPPSDIETNLVSHFLASMNELFEQVLQSSSVGYTVGVTIKTKRIKMIKQEV